AVRQGADSTDQMGRRPTHAFNLLRHPVSTLGSWPGSPGPGCAARFRKWAALRLLHRNLAAGPLSGDRAACPFLGDPDPDQRIGGAAVVRLRLSADGLD